MTRPVRIANCSGFYGDRLAAAREMVDGGPIDVLTGDYLAELTMLILAKAQAKDPDAGYARTFLTQLQDVLGTCLERGIRIVANAGGLNPAGLAAAIDALGLPARVAYVEGDDLPLIEGRVRELLGPEAAELPIDVHLLPNLRALNVVVHGLLGDGVASSTRPDPQAKGLGEYLRSRIVDVPTALL
jgi:hypothetical protein